MSNQGRRRWIARLLLLVVTGFVSAQDCLALQPEPELRQQVWSAIARRWKLNSQTKLPGDLQLLRSNAPLPAGSQLRVITSRPGPERNVWLIRLDCEERRDCLPFYAVFRPAEADPAISVTPLGTQPRAQIRSAESQKYESSLQRAGDRVEVVEEFSGMHLKTRGVCLQAGAIGDRIRVRNLSTHRILLVTVAGEGRVRVER